MALLRACSAFAVLTLASHCLADAAGTLSLPIAKSRQNARLSKRDPVSVGLQNNIQAQGYIVNTTIGTPGQQISFVIDTGSSDVWTFAPGVCQQGQQTGQQSFHACFGGSFDNSKSSSYKATDVGGFEIQYGDGSGVEGDYFTDNIGIGGSTLNNFTMALARQSDGNFIGVMGVGYPINEAPPDQGSGGGGSGGFGDPFGGSGGGGGATYTITIDRRSASAQEPAFSALTISPGGGSGGNGGGNTIPSITPSATFGGAGALPTNPGSQDSPGNGNPPGSNPTILDLMVQQGIIKTHAYSLWLDDLNAATGTILFGGMDTSRFIPPMVALPIQPDPEYGVIATFTVDWSSLGVTTNGSSQSLQGSFPAPALLDSGTSLIYIPDDLLDPLKTYFNTVDDDDYGTLIACDGLPRNGTLDFGFGGNNGAVIAVPFSELAIPAFNPDNGNKPLTFSNGRKACFFALQPAEEDEPIIFGDPFLRSAYVVYDLANEQIGMAQTNFNPGPPNVQALSSGPNVQGASVTATQALSDSSPSPTSRRRTSSEFGNGATGAPGVIPSPSGSGFGSISGSQPTQFTQSGVSIAATAATSSGAASADARDVSMTGTMAVILLSGGLAMAGGLFGILL